MTQEIIDKIRREDPQYSGLTSREGLLEMLFTVRIKNMVRKGQQGTPQCPRCDKQMKNVDLFLTTYTECPACSYTFSEGVY